MPSDDSRRSPSAVAVEGVSKTFRIPEEQMHTLKERALHPLRRTRFHRFEAVRDVSFDVGTGEFFGIVGRNGSGKSTLLKCLAGIYGVDAGDIYVTGRMSTFIELGVGFNPDLAAYDNVITNAMMLGLSPKEAARRFDDVIAFAELEEFVDLKIKNYSSGMLVRLAFSVAIQAEADILLIDEVLAVGDASFQQKCFDVFHSLREQGRTILFVTHDMGLVQRLCDRAMLLERGHVVTIGDTDEVAQRYIELNFGAEDRQASHRHPTAPDTPAEVLEAWTEDPAGERVDVLRHGEHYRVKVRVAFHEEVTSPVFNLVFVNEFEQNVFAASNVSKAPDLGTLEPGETVLFEIDFLNALGPGRFELSMVVQRQSGIEEIARRERFKSFLVTNPTPMGGLVDLPFECRLERIPGGATVATPNP